MYGPPTPARENTMGIAGFVCSLVGLVSCGLICPIGAILSFVGCFKQPRGLAIAGLIIGIVGSLWLLIFALFIGMAGITFVMLALGLGRYGEVGLDAIAIHTEVAKYVATNKTLPTSLADLPNLSTDAQTDPWGTTYSLSPDPSGNTFTITSAGPDRTFDTSDDVRISESPSPSP